MFWRPPASVLLPIRLDGARPELVPRAPRAPAIRLRVPPPPSGLPQPIQSPLNTHDAVTRPWSVEVAQAEADRQESTSGTRRLLRSGPVPPPSHTLERWHAGKCLQGADLHPLAPAPPVSTPAASSDPQSARSSAGAVPGVCGGIRQTRGRRQTGGKGAARQWQPVQGQPFAQTEKAAGRL
jgi:hypothetical protein